MANKRKLKLVPHNAAACSQTPAALRQVIKEINAGKVTGVSFAVTYRNGEGPGAVYTYSQADSPLQQLGAVQLLAEHIKKNHISIE